VLVVTRTLEGLAGATTAAACVTVCVLPATVTVAMRDVALTFGDTTYTTVALPLPLIAPAFPPLTEANVSHDALLVAVHAQPVADVRFTAPSPPLAGSEADAADSV
jgi:hypothetical protein